MSSQSNYYGARPSDAEIEAWTQTEHLIHAVESRTEVSTKSYQRFHATIGGNDPNIKDESHKHHWKQDLKNMKTAIKGIAHVTKDLRKEVVKEERREDREERIEEERRDEYKEQAQEQEYENDEEEGHGRISGFLDGLFGGSVGAFIADVSFGGDGGGDGDFGGGGCDFGGGE